MKNNDITAIVFPNQHIATGYYYSLKTAGIRIPEDFSIIAIDNYPDFAPHKISTIDLKLDVLGYNAARVFIGDMPANADKEGSVYPCPVYIDRGSIAPSRK
jgi:DNA-binding LacI/PurR family transcriptional regulator